MTNHTYTNQELESFFSGSDFADSVIMELIDNIVIKQKDKHQAIFCLALARLQRPHLAYTIGALIEQSFPRPDNHTVIS